MRHGRVFTAFFGLACALGVAACGAEPLHVTQHTAQVFGPASATRDSSGSCPIRSGFSLSLVSDRGGQPTPVAAAFWFARHGGVPAIPMAGWRQASRSGASALVRSGDVTVHAIEGPDRTWQIDSGERCG
jgi:hypothetical protein